MNSRSFFSDFDFAQFWEQSDYATKEYVGAAITDHLVKQVETRLGYTLPKSYVEFMKFQNGGIPKRTHHRIKLSDDYIVITGIYSIGDEKPCSLCGEFGSQFWIDEWGYPPIGIYFADCPSAGHDMLCLDYRKSGPNGEPRIIHIDQESDYKTVLVAENFEQFIRGLEDEAAFL